MCNKFSNDFIEFNLEYIKTNMYSKDFVYNSEEKSLPRVEKWLNDCFFSDHFKYSKINTFENKVRILSDYLDQALNDNEKIDVIWLEYFSKNREKFVEKNLIDDDLAEILLDDNKLIKWLQQFKNNKAN